MEFEENQYDILLKCSDYYIGVIKNRPVKPQIGDILLTEYYDEWYDEWYEVIGFPKNMKPLKRQSWVVELFYSCPFHREKL